MVKRRDFIKMGRRCRHRSSQQPAGACSRPPTDTSYHLRAVAFRPTRASRARVVVDRRRHGRRHRRQVPAHLGRHRRRRHADRARLGLCLQHHEQPGAERQPHHEFAAIQLWQACQPLRREDRQGRRGRNRPGRPQRHAGQRRALCLRPPGDRPGRRFRHPARPRDRRGAGQGAARLEGRPADHRAAQHDHRHASRAASSS